VPWCRDLRWGSEQLIVEPLMIPLPVMVKHVLTNDIPKMHLPERGHSTQALLLSGLGAAVSRPAVPKPRRLRLALTFDDARNLLT